MISHSKCPFVCHPFTWESSYTLLKASWAHSIARSSISEAPATWLMLKITSMTRVRHKTEGAPENTVIHINHIVIQSVTK